MGIEPGLQYGGPRRIQWAIAAPLLRTLFDLSLSLYLSALGRHVGRLRSCLCKDKNAKNDEIGMWNAYDPYLRFRYYLKNTNSFAIEQRQSISNLSNCCDYTMKDVFAKLGHLGVKSNVAIISTNLFLQSFSQFSFHLETTRERERNSHSTGRIFPIFNDVFVSNVFDIFCRLPPPSLTNVEIRFKEATKRWQTTTTSTKESEMFFCWSCETLN